jgi:hypothetical protein
MAMLSVTATSPELEHFEVFGSTHETFSGAKQDSRRGGESSRAELST